MDVPERDYHRVDPGNTFMMVDAIFSDAFKPFIVPIAGLIVGAVMILTQVERAKTIGKLVLYFGAQCFMNVYMSWVMRNSVTVPQGTIVGGKTLQVPLTGCPAGFALAAVQQIVSFIVFWFYVACVYCTPRNYTPKKLGSCADYLVVCVFGCAFALNIALNNFSLGYISVAGNLIIRSYLPLTTFLSSQALSMCGLFPKRNCRWKEIAMMIIGVLCAGVFTTARIMGTIGFQEEGKNMILGVGICVASVFCGSLNLALAGVLGEGSAKLNAYDTVAYMAVPATLFLLPIALLMQKPVPGIWSEVFGMKMMSDWQIMLGVWKLNRTTFLWLVLSGVFSFFYNIIQFSVVQTLSPSATAFGGNFNKAAMIFLTLLLPFFGGDKLPGMPYIAVIWATLVTNIAAFSHYISLHIESRRKEEEEARKQQMRDAGLSSGSEDEAILDQNGDPVVRKRKGGLRRFLACCRKP